MDNLQMLSMIANADLTKEQRSVLLKELANKIINEHHSSKENLSEEYTEKELSDENLKSMALKERIEGYKEKHRKEEEIRIKKKLEDKRNSELEEKAQILGEIRNRHGENVYGDTSKMTGYEIEADYKAYEGTKELEEAKQIYEQKSNVVEEKQTDFTNDEINQILGKEDENPITMDDLNAIKVEEPKKEGLGRKLVKSISTALDKVRLGMDKYKQVAYDEAKLQNYLNYVEENVRIRN